jgi:hypothetical protein
MRISKTLLLALVLVAALGAVAVAGSTFRGSVKTSHVRVTSSGDVTIAGASGRRGNVRSRYLLPRTWRRDSSVNARTLRFDTRNSCHHKVTFTPRLVQAEDVPAAERAAARTPATAQYVQAQGTREGAAFRVVRTRGSSNLTGVLVQPLSKTYTPGVAAGERVFAEIVARATADPRTECHSGGPRTVGDAIGDGFAAGGAGGFALRQR